MGVDAPLVGIVVAWALLACRNPVDGELPVVGALLPAVGVPGEPSAVALAAGAKTGVAGRAWTGAAGGAGLGVGEEPPITVMFMPAKVSPI